MSHQDLLRAGAWRSALAASVLLCAALVLYLSQTEYRFSGNSWQGYVLGGCSLLMIIWLALLGVRKRHYQAQNAIQRWVAAHVVWGVAVVFVVLLHMDGQLGPNVHGVAFVFLLVVVVSGILGCGLYLLAPRALLRLRGDGGTAGLLAELHELTTACRELASRCPTELMLVVDSSISGSRLPAGLFARLLGQDHSTVTLPTDTGVMLTQDNAGQRRLLTYLADYVARAPSQYMEPVAELMRQLGRRHVLLDRLRKEQRLQTWLRAWLLLHIPATGGLLAAIVVHVVVVFLYW